MIYLHCPAWNEELLYVGGFLCRMVYEQQVFNIQTSWEEAATAKPSSCPSHELQHQLQERFHHVLKFFMFHHSTPSPKVAQLLVKSFHECSTLPLMFLSSVGVLGSPDVRAFDSAFAKFLKSLPMLSEYATVNCAHFIRALPDRHKIPETTPSDILRTLCCSTLGAEELAECLRWWISSRLDSQTLDMADLLQAASFGGTHGDIRLSSITHFVDPKILGPHIPHDGPLPPTILPIAVSTRFSPEDLATFGWEEFPVASWLQYISSHTADEKYDITQSVDWASRVLTTLSCVWSKLSKDMQSESSDVFKNKSCIPTSKGLRSPECSYLLIADNPLFNHIDLPIVCSCSEFRVDEDMMKLLLLIGVRSNPPVELLSRR